MEKDFYAVCLDKQNVPMEEKVCAYLILDFHFLYIVIIVCGNAQV